MKQRNGDNKSPREALPPPPTHTHSHLNPNEKQFGQDGGKERFQEGSL